MFAVGLAALAPWTSLLEFGAIPAGYRTGHSQRTFLQDGRRMAAAWAANVAYRDIPAADPPNRTLERFPSSGIIVWAQITSPPVAFDGRRVTTTYRLDHAYRFPCCEAAAIAGGEREMYGFGPKRRHSVVIRVYFASPPNRPAIQHAQRAIDALRLPDVS